MNRTAGSRGGLPYLLGLVALGCSCLAGCNASPSTSPEPSASPAADVDPASETAIRLRDITAKSGIEFVHTDGSRGQHHIVETISCGLALFDYDGDRLIDIFFCNGVPLAAGALDAGHTTLPALYRNLGGMRFQDVTRPAGLAQARFGLGATVGDYDNDGRPDLYLSNFGANVLYRNQGDGTFDEVTDDAEVGLGDHVGAGVSFLDIDQDHDLDLAVGNYVQFSLADKGQPPRRSRSVYPGPFDYPPSRNVLFRNEGDGRWSDVSRSAGIGVQTGTAMGMVSGDLDDDGDLDIYVANDEMANFLYRNDGSGMFEESAIAMGAAFDAAGLPSGSMGVDCGDVDNDGRLDLYVTSFARESATLYRMSDHQIFQDVTLSTGAGQGTFEQVTWGCCMGDLDHDGDRDLFIACGHLDDRDQNRYYRAANVVLANQLIQQGQLQFVDVSARAGDVAKVRESSRGAAVDDLDNDGDLDLVVLNSRRPPTLLENTSPRKPADAHWLQVELRGRSTNRDAVGTRVRVVCGDRAWVDEVRSGRGYQSHWGSRLHFGIGRAARIDQVEVEWFGGARQVLRHVPVNQCLMLVQPAATRSSPAPRPDA